MLIERCLDEGTIALYAQEVFGLPGRNPVHTEVMARMLRAQGEPIPAAQFLPMAARHGLIGRMDCRIFEKLLDHLARNAGPATVALNVAARTIADPEMLRRLLALLDARAGLACRLIFEMTEFGALHDWKLAQQFSGEVRRRGAHFALDNFGMLQESLMLVHALRPQYIKLSPGYSREIAGNADCRFLVASLVRIAQPLGIGIYAQAVEDEALVPRAGRARALRLPGIRFVAPGAHRLARKTGTVHVFRIQENVDCPWIPSRCQISVVSAAWFSV